MILSSAAEIGGHRTITLSNGGRHRDVVLRETRIAAVGCSSNSLGVSCQPRRYDAILLRKSRLVQPLVDRCSVEILRGEIRL